MLEIGGFWPNDGGNTSSGSYSKVMDEVHVLLVDHDSDCLISTAKMLELCSYKVTYVELASTALSMLSSAKSNFDLVMANINSPDMHGYKLLQQAVNMDIPVILMSVEDNVFLATEALEIGALLYIEKPVTVNMLKCLWQHVAREKMGIYKEKEMRQMGTTEENNKMRGIEFRGEIEDGNNIIGSDNMKDKNYVRKKKVLEPEYQIINIKDKRKLVYTKWTQELHGKFMDAVGQLGEGRCFPKEILKRMKVPGLTRVQVASHLQKCRNDNWQPPGGQKYRQNNVPAASLDTDPSGQNKPRRFGSMPHDLKKNSSLFYQEKASEGSKSYFEKEISNYGGHETINMAPIMNSHQQYQESGPSNVRTCSNPSSNPRFSSNGFFNFPEMDCLIHSYSSMHQGSVMNMNPRTSPEPFHDSNQVYPDQQNSAMPNVDSRSK